MKIIMKHLEHEAFRTKTPTESMLSEHSYCSCYDLFQIMILGQDLI